MKRLKLLQCIVGVIPSLFKVITYAAFGLFLRFSSGGFSSVNGIFTSWTGDLKNMATF